MLGLISREIRPMHSTLAFAPTPQDLAEDFFDRPVLSLRPVCPPAGRPASASSAAAGTQDTAPPHPAPPRAPESR